MKFQELKEEKGSYIFNCPGCGNLHQVWTNAPNDLTGAKWNFNGDVDKPTVSPSLLLRRPYFREIDADGAGVKGTEYTECCHSFIKDGNIQFLSDCTHSLAGQTVEIPEFNK